MFHSLNISFEINIIQAGFLLQFYDCSKRNFNWAYIIPQPKSYSILHLHNQPVVIFWKMSVMPKVRFQNIIIAASVHRNHRSVRDDSNELIRSQQNNRGFKQKFGIYSLKKLKFDIYSPQYKNWIMWFETNNKLLHCKKKRWYISPEKILLLQFKNDFFTSLGVRLFQLLSLSTYTIFRHTRLIQFFNFFGMFDLFNCFNFFVFFLLFSRLIMTFLSKSHRYSPLNKS